MGNQFDNKVFIKIIKQQPDSVIIKKFRELLILKYDKGFPFLQSIKTSCFIPL